jgi:hypothetical protein
MVVAASETALWVTATAGVVGALVGGGVTGGLTLWGETRRQEFAERMERSRNEREDAERALAVRAAARVLRHRLKATQVIVEVAVEMHAWWPAETNLVAELPAREWRLLAASMTPDDWGLIERAERRLLAIREAHSFLDNFDESEELPELGDKNLESLRETFDALGKAVAALEALDDAPALR